MAGSMGFGIISELRRREIEGKLSEWDENLREMRLTSLQHEGDLRGRYRGILRDLTTRVETLRSRWQRIRGGRVYVPEEE